MAKWAVGEFGGEIPRRDPLLIPEGAAAEAYNLDLSAGTLDGLPIPELVKNLSAIGGIIKRAYRFPGPDPGDPDVWLPLPSPFSSVVRSPLANDTLHRLYWTNPGEGGFWATYDMIAAETPPYNMGYIPPDDTFKPVVTAFGGTDPTVVPWVARSYLVTFVDSFGAESQPSLPSDVVQGASDGTWTVVMPTILPGQPVGKNYPLPVTMRLYRTVTGQSTGAAFYLVHEWDMASDPPPGTGYIDDTLDTVVVGNDQLTTLIYNTPLENIDGLVSMPGGFLCAFEGTTVHFSEPDKPHAWPAAYDLSVQNPIVGFGVWAQSLMVLTEGPPWQGTGNSPAGFTMSVVQIQEPCISRGSIVTDMGGVYYASQNGLVLVNYNGLQNQTASLMTKNIWLHDFHAAAIIGCRYRNQYLAINGTGLGFMIDYTEERMGVAHMNTFAAADCIWNDPYTGDAYVMSAKHVYRWDSPDTGNLTWRWRSKLYFVPDPTNLAAVQVLCDPRIITDVAPSSPPPMETVDARLALPANTNGLFRYYADGVLKLERKLLVVNDIFTLPSGFMAFKHQFELVSRSPIKSVQLASSMRELKNV